MLGDQLWTDHLTLAIQEMVTVVTTYASVTIRSSNGGEISSIDHGKGRILTA